MNVMEQSHLVIAKQLIELKYNVKVTTIEFEDGSGRKFIVTETSNPLKKRFIVL
jgi:L-2-hydroxyglutarate oxidase LhgO